jgi:UDP-N-acetylglucosamine 2-epimerase (non-hydrolysing)
MIDIICGARPNFMKVDPVIRNLKSVSVRLIHTGQHYDYSMSQSFFEQLELPLPDVNLGIGSDTVTVQTARIMESYEKVLLGTMPEAVVVVGDVNSTLACALTAVRHGIPPIHIEAGLRSFDRTMPEEVNRVLTDQVSDFLLITSGEARYNLIREGRSTDSIVMVGNPMIDTLMRLLPRALVEGVDPPGNPFCLITLHRPSNVDDPERLSSILESLGSIRDLDMVFPAHPRTMRNIEMWGMQELVPQNLTITPPMGYLDFIRHQSEAAAVLTDSGGVQEESSVLGVPCVTVRPNTERPVTLELGTSVLCNDPCEIPASIEKQIASRPSEPPTIPMWDGRAGARIATAITDFLQNRGSRTS